MNNTDHKILILPWCSALSITEINSIKSWVSGGGTVIADLIPGNANEHCKPYTQSPLDCVFGVTQNTTSPGIIKSTSALGANAPITNKFLDTTRCSSTLLVANGTAHGTVSGTANAPLLVINNYGNGKSVLMNFTLDTYLNISKIAGASNAKGARADIMDNFFKDLYDELGGTYPLLTTPEPEGVKTYVFNYNGARYVGVFRELPEESIKYADNTAAPLVSESCTLNFGETAHII